METELITEEERKEMNDFIQNTWSEFAKEHSKGIRGTEALITEFGNRIKKYLLDKSLERTRRSLGNLEREKILLENYLERGIE